MKKNLIKEKSIDIKFQIPTDLITYYINELGYFYSVIDENGDIQYFSEDFLTYFSIKSIYEMNNQSIKNFIGSENWAFLEENLISNPEKDEYSILNHTINNTKFKLKWKFYKEDERLYYFLIFKRHEEKLKEYNIFEYVLESSNIPITIIKNNDFFFKNIQFENFVKINEKKNFTEFYEWLKSNCNDNMEQDIFPDMSEDWETEMSMGEEKLFITNKIIPDNASVLTIIKKEISKEKEIKHEAVQQEIGAKEIVAEPSDLLPKQMDNIAVQLDGVKNMIKNFYERDSMEFNINSSALIDGLKNKYKNYESIIKYTQENLIKLQDTSVFIDDIAVKIHLISINAAIESARTGEAGKGFSVISKEIAKLSSSINAYAKSINKQIDSIRQYTVKIISSETKEISQSDYTLNISVSMQEEVNKILSKFENSIFSEIDKIKNSITKH